MSGAENLKLEWTVRLSSRQPQRVGAIFGMAALALLVGAVWIGPIVGILGAAMVLGATAEFWMPTKCTLDEKGGAVRLGFSVSVIEWPNVKRVVIAEDGVKLSPLADTTRSAPFRGVFLRYESNRDEVLSLVRRLAHEHTRYVELGADGGGDGGASEGGGEGDPEEKNGNSGDPPS